MSKLYISRIRQPDGTLVIDPDPRTHRETMRLSTLNRMLGGMTTQVWTLTEAKEKFPAELADIEST